MSNVSNNQVKATAKNVIFRKAAQKIEELFIARSEYMDQLENENTERFTFINNFLYMIDMLVYNEGVVCLNGKKVSDWLKLSLMDKAKAVSNFLETYYLEIKEKMMLKISSSSYF